MYKAYKGHILFAQSKVISLDDFLKIMGVEKTKFGGKILEMMYNAIYIWSRDLKSEYIKYYSVEYDTIEKYLNYMIGIEFKGINLEKEHLCIFHGIRMSNPQQSGCRFHGKADDNSTPKRMDKQA